MLVALKHRIDLHYALLIKIDLLKYYLMNLLLIKSNIKMYKILYFILNKLKFFVK